MKNEQIRHPQNILQELLDDGVGSGVEQEREDISNKIDDPFDPEKIKVSKTTKTINLLISRIEHREIDLAPDFQRSPNIWNATKKSQLIESLLLRIPLPVFYVSSDVKENWAVVDGLQRLTTIHDFVKDKFQLTGLEYLSTSLDGKNFSALPRNMARRIGETELNINVIEPGTPENVMFNIFKRINTGGLPLNAQEIRHALNRGQVREFLKKLAQDIVFLDATTRSVNDQRMAARECVLRFLAFEETPWSKYASNDLDGFLNGAMRSLNGASEKQLKRLEGVFQKAMKAAIGIFGEDAFRKRYYEGESRSPISKALFEAWAVNLAAKTDDEINILVAHKKLVKKHFMDLMNNDQAFVAAISTSTGSRQRVEKRFKTIKGLIDDVIDASERT